ncbi:MAG TPA: CapA family protein [Candidatus Paceibacterota bacterium]
MRLRPFLIVITLLFFATLLLFKGSTEILEIFHISPSPTPKKEVSMIFVGDIMLSRSVGKKMVETNDFSYPFRKISDFLSSADITFANLETPVSDRGVKVGSIYSFRTDPRAMAGLIQGGIDVVSLANNHIWDYGRQAFTDTMEHLKNAGISYIGAGEYAEIREGVVKDIHDTKIGFLAYTNLAPQGVQASPERPGVSNLDEELMVQDIQNLKQKSDIVAVSFHWGDEYKTEHNIFQERIAEIAIDAGADLIIGHHPHVVQEVEKYKSGWIAYSLGNFIFDQNFSKETMTGLALKVILKDKKVNQVESLPIHISQEYQPSL